VVSVKQQDGIAIAGFAGAQKTRAGPEGIVWTEVENA
jgi:hypothetical protein